VGYGIQPGVPPFYYFSLAGTTHQSFLSDLMLLYPHLDDFEPYGFDSDGNPIPIIRFSSARSAVEMLNAYIVGFFNEELRPEELGGDDITLPPDLSLDVLKRIAPIAYLVQFLEQPVSTPSTLACDVPGPPPGPGPGPGPAIVPEPGTITLMGIGLLGLLALARKMRRKTR
jgi:hypothetical protein